jgi:ribosomal protein L7/L12
MNKNQIKINLSEFKKSGDKLKAVAFIKSLTEVGLKQAKDLIETTSYDIHKINITKTVEAIYTDKEIAEKIRNKNIKEVSFLCNKLMIKHQL